MITKAIIPAAGLGTRFLPASKSVPKELFPVLEKPAMQYCVEEGVKAGIKNFVVVSNTNKHNIIEHFSPYSERDFMSLPQQQQTLMASLQKATYSADFTYVPQAEPLGLGHAVWAARHAVGKEHCAVMLPDDIITGASNAIAQLMKIAVQEKCNVVAVQEVPSHLIHHYGIISIKKQFSPNLFQVKELIEKPSPTMAPSNLAIVGRYVLSPQIFDSLDEISSSSTGEIHLTDGIQNLLFSGEKVFAYKVPGMWYDIGNPMGLIKANIDLALKHPDYAEEMSRYLQELDREMALMQGKAQAIKPAQF